MTHVLSKCEFCDVQESRDKYKPWEHDCAEYQKARADKAEGQLDYVYGTGFREGQESQLRSDA